MLVVDWINYKLEEKIEAYAFKILFIDNYSVFENLNIIKLSIHKIDAL